MNTTEKSSLFEDYMHLWETPEKCDACRLPLHIMSGKKTLFCPMCRLDEINARRGRAMLAQARQMVQDLRNSALRQRLMKADAGRSMFGMPL